MMEEQVTSGPYRATLLWNSLIRAFKFGIPLSRHRRYMKTYEECFVASDAVVWLHQYLKKNPNFGTDVTRAQTVQLLQKLYHAGIFEDVRGSKHNSGEFTDSGRLFRPTVTSPSRVLRTPLALKNNLKLANAWRSPLIQNSLPLPIKLDFQTMTPVPFEKMASMPSLSDNATTLPEYHFMSKPLTTEEIEQQWKVTTLESLQKILGINGLDDMVDSHKVSGQYIRHNCLYINKSGVVTNIDTQEQLPHWALSAMKCLAYWPNRIDENLPNYPGFEKDVFKVVRDYFCGLKEPLTTYNMYDVITNVFVKASICTANNIGLNGKSNCAYSNSTPKSFNAFKSFENLLEKITSVSKPHLEYQDVSEVSISGHVLDLSPINPVLNACANTSGGITTEDVHPITRYETAFGPDNKTITRIFYGDAFATNGHHLLGNTEQKHSPEETKFRQSPVYSEPHSFCRKSANRHSVHSRQPSITKKKCVRDSNRRGSVGQYLNEACTYSGTMGSNAKSSSNGLASESLTSKSVPDTGSDVCADENPGKGQRYINSKPPICAMPPSYDSLFPESLCPVSVQPVVHATKRLKNRKSISNSSLSIRRSCVKTLCSKRGSASVSDSVQRNKDMIVTRSLSLSDLAMTAPPLENELQKQCTGNTPQREQCVNNGDSTEKIIRAMQLICLLLPPASRRRLHLLLRLMNKMSTNEKLVLDKTQNSRSLLLETFYRVILCCQDESKMDDLLALQLVAFLMDNYMSIFIVPTDLKCSAEARIEKLQRTKIYYSSESMCVRYCQQVSLDEYKNQKKFSLQHAMETLLDEIITDKTMAPKEKNKRLKQFQKMHPDIYERKFACVHDTAVKQPKIKQSLLTKPLLKLKGLRL